MIYGGEREREQPALYVHKRRCRCRMSIWLDAENWTSDCGRR